MADGGRIIDKPLESLGVGSTIVFVDNEGNVKRVEPSEVGGVGPQGPQGETGNTGATGPAGATGAQGIQGATGATGPTGPKGDKGDKGDQGDPGPQGVQGAPGVDGADGGAGPQGPSGAGMVPNEYGGLNEAKVTAIETADVDWNLLVVIGGDTRSNKTIPAGISGDMGGHLVHFNATTNAWNDIGPVSGVEGPAGPQGVAGPTGATGAQGPAGAAGATGPAGAKGDTGDPGPKGDPGDPGATGPAGAAGATGATGATGAKGDKGDKGDTGNTGAAGLGVPTGGAVGAHLRKTTTADGATEWGLGVRFNTQTGTAYTLALTDADAVVRMTNAGAKAVTIPNNTTVAFPVNTCVFVSNSNDADVLLTLTPASGVTLRKPSDQLLTLPRWAGAALLKVGTNEWECYGGMTPQ